MLVIEWTVQCRDLPMYTAVHHKLDQILYSFSYSCWTRLPDERRIYRDICHHASLLLQYKFRVRHQ